MVNGKRPRFTYGTKGEAETKAEQLRIERENDGNTIFALSASDQSDAGRAVAILAPFNVSLSTAAQFYKTHAGLIQTKRTVSQVANELLVAKAQDNLSARHRKNLRLQLKEGFAADERFASRPIYEITTGELETWLRELDVSPTTRNNYRTALGVLFSFALRRGYVLKNPAVLAQRAKIKAEKPAILTLAEVRALMQSTADDFIPAVALGLFAGLRPESEVWTLDWSQIDFKEKTVDVNESKNLAGERFVKMSENLIEWLRPHAQKSGPVSVSGDAYYYRLQIARDKGALVLRKLGEPCPNLETWRQDSLRHSFASYHYGLNKNAHETAEQMGHVGGLRIFFRHYRNRVREEAAREFWAIRPTRV